MDINSQLKELYIKNEIGQLDRVTYVHCRSSLIDSYVLEAKIDSIPGVIENNYAHVTERNSSFAIVFVTILVLFAVGVLVNHLISLDYQLLSGKSMIPAQALSE